MPRLLPSVRAALLQHGVAVSDDDDPARLRAQLNEVYLGEVRALKARQKGGEIALADYASHVDALRRRFPLLGLPIAGWTEPAPTQPA